MINVQNILIDRLLKIEYDQPSPSERYKAVLIGKQVRENQIKALW